MRHITTLEMHTEGEPLRIITSGLDPIPGKTIVEKRAYAKTHLDGLRRFLMFEPRGHADMYGAILTEPVTPGADVGVLFLHNEGWSTMCGHGIIALTKALADGLVAPPTGAITPKKTEWRIDAPAGLITARRLDGSRSAFENVPSFALALDEVVDVPSLGPITYDIGFGGAFYAYVDVAQVGLDLTPENNRALIETGMAIKRAVMSSRVIPHPFEAELSFLYGTIFGGPPHNPRNQARNVCIFAEGEVDRSPTGTGVSGRLALEHAHGRLRAGEDFTIESILGTTFTGKILRETTFGGHAAIVPEVSGRAWVTGRNEFWLEDDDPLGKGFILR